MIYEIYTENGTKKKRALTGNGYGLPLGSIIAVYSNLVPDGYLPCNGAVYDTTTYAALYAYLGSNRLPDLRECNLVGAGQSSNDYDASTNPNGIHEHDVYDVGEFKDDQLQNHGHKDTWQDAPGTKFSSSGSINIQNFPSGTTPPKTASNCRTGTTTHGKQVGVNYCIKATPAYVEPDTVSDMINTLRTQDSYSTSEVNTGKKWIDGKPIYRKAWGGLSLSYTSAGTIDTGLSISNIALITKAEVIFRDVATSFTIDSYTGGWISNINSANHLLLGNNSYRGTIKAIMIEYTKTTD